MSEDFKSITMTFNKANKDVKEIIKDINEKTGRTKVDIICDAIRFYNNNNNVNSNTIDKEQIKGMVKESLLDILLQQQFSGGIQVIQGIQQIQTQEKSKEQLEQERLNSLNKKDIDMSLLSDDD